MYFIKYYSLVPITMQHWPPIGSNLKPSNLTPEALLHNLSNRYSIVK